MKKILALVLAMMLVLSMGFAFATEQDLKPHLDVPKKIVKEYLVVNGTAPAEDFTFTFGDGTGVDFDDVAITEDIPSINDVVIHYDSKAAADDAYVAQADIVLDAEDFPGLGIYTYPVSETDNNVAGVSYNTEENELKLVVTILRDEENNQQYVAALHYASGSDDTDKTGAVKNQYDSGSLKVTKEITGNMANMEETFSFKVVFTAPSGDTVKSDITYTKLTDGKESEPATIAAGEGWTTKEHTFTLGHADNIVFTNLPAGVTYEVTETTPDDYTLTIKENDETVSAASGNIEANDEDAFVFENNKTDNVDTGINMDSVPYIVLIGIVVLAGAAMMLKKRSYND